jgi:hypothetical protein
MRVLVTEETVQVRLAPWEKLLGLMRNITVARADISDVEIVENPVREAMGTGIKVGLRVPGLIYIARTLRLDQVFIVRRRVPGLSFVVSNHTLLHRVLLSTRQAEELARQLRSG